MKRYTIISGMRLLNIKVIKTIHNLFQYHVF